MVRPTISSLPSASTTMWCLRPKVFFAPSKPRLPWAAGALTV